VIPRLAESTAADTRPTDDEIRAMFGQITDLPARAAARAVASATGLSANEVYDIVQRGRT
jgi:hypothetical protein